MSFLYSFSCQELGGSSKQRMPPLVFEILVALQPLIQSAMKTKHLFPKVTQGTPLHGALGLALINLLYLTRIDCGLLREATWRGSDRQVLDMNFRTTRPKNQTLRSHEFLQLQHLRDKET